MIRDSIALNETAKPNDYELARLRAALPEYFDADGSFMIDRLQEVLHDSDVDLTREGYELNFLGKSYAKYLTSTKTETVVVPDITHNAQPENKYSENLYIVGDNLDALKHLLGSYSGEVNCIYIDPPYNTGSDGFVYNDDFGFTASHLVEKIGISEDEAERVLDLRGKSSHSAWLTFMYPRLQLAKQLLADDGVIFISIDDNEQSNLRLLCDEILGEQNFVGHLIPQTNPRGRTFDRFIAKTHEYVLAYTRTDSDSALSMVPKSQKALSAYSRTDENGAYRLLELRNRNPIFNRSNRPNLFYPFFVDPETKKVSLEQSELYCQAVFPRNSEGVDGCWTWSARKAHQNRDLLVGHQANTGKWTVFRKDYLDESSSSTKSKSLLLGSGMNHEKGKERVRSLFGYTPFDFPKSVEFVEYLLRLGTKKGDLVLDFFSGSGTIADSVMTLNQKTQANVRYIAVQIPEKIEEGHAAAKHGFRTIDDIGRERIKLAAAKIKEDSGSDIDYGFKLYRLEEPSGAVLDDILSFEPDKDGALLAGDYLSKFELNGTPGHDTVLATWMVEDGYGLTASAEKVELASYGLDVCGDSAYVIAPGLTSEDVVELVRKLENGELAVSRVVVFGYSVTFGVMHELKKNLSVLKSGRTVNVIERL